MRYMIASVLALAGLVPVAAQAQDTEPMVSDSSGTFAGFRIEGNVGWDKMQSYDNNNEKLGYGGSAGFDGNLTKRIVIGPEVNYWRPNHNRNSVYSDIAPIARQGREIWGSAVRVGYRLTPDMMVFAKGGYANQAQATYYTDPTGYVTRVKDRVDGYQVGGGIQYSPNNKFGFVPANVYVSAQYVYSNFANHTADQHAMAGIGIRFR